MLQLLLKPFRSSAARERKPPHTRPAAQVKPSGEMTLQQRMAWRREMTYQSVREHLLSLQVLSAMYRARVTAVDERHHRFVVMLEISTMFEARLAGEALELQRVEKHLRERTYLRYGVVIEDVYWKVNQEVDIFPDEARREGEPAVRPAGKTHRPTAQNEILSKAMAATRDKMSRNSFEPVTEQERRAFVEAQRNGMRAPPMKVGDNSYQSDLAPLEPSIPANATRYGDLN
jgi:hypothetical protein